MNNSGQVYTTYIKTTAEKLWAAITNPEFTRQYWGGMSNVSDWKVGAKWEHKAPGDPEPWILGKVLECNPPKRLVLTWVDPENQADVSRVTFEIEPVEDSMCLRVVHDDFKADSTMVHKVSQGWPRVISSLKTFLETGKALNVFCKQKCDAGKSGEQAA